MKTTASITCNRPAPIDFYALKNDLYGNWLDMRKGDKPSTPHSLMIARKAYDTLVYTTESWAADFDDELEAEIEELIWKNPATGYTVRKLINEYINNQFDI